ncbi:MAG: succinate dehydrogenase, cytochrome b556 subunit [Betaproteobacteria bacterium]|nr:succinate dehydrogenase, cytochrome b556 subunit [Betaproteobacteria bacterium]MDH3435750.1 succinate dehydrogenase, cytochrome b556 subunit [Betaproteobacteria bacterium]
MTKPRPKHLNLFQIRLPLPGVISIMHRVFGATLFLVIPLLLYAMQLSLESPQSFDGLKSVMAHPLVKLVILGLVWAYLHHFCAGIRYLALDLDYGTELGPARASAKAVVAVSVALTLLIGMWLW